MMTTIEAEITRLVEVRDKTRIAIDQMIDENAVKVSFLGREIRRIDLGRLQKFLGLMDYKIKEAVSRKHGYSFLWDRYVEIETEHTDYLAFPLLIYDGIAD